MTDPIRWAEQLACYPFMSGEALWATESLIEHAKRLQQEVGILRILNRQIHKRLMREQVSRLAFSQPAAEDFIRSGNLECKACGFEYADHPNDPVEPYLKVLCNMDRVKL